MYRRELIQAPAQKVRKLIAQLHLDDVTLKMASDIIGQSSLKTPVESLRKDWLNEALASGLSSAFFKNAIQDPSRSFLKFTLDYTSNPNEPAQRVLNKLATSYGHEFVGHFHMVQWPVEIAWAERLRNHEDDEICVCADLFLKLIETKGATKVFSDLVSFSHQLPPPESGSNTSHLLELSKDEIETAPLDAINFEPRCIRYVRTASAKTLRKIPEAKFSEHAQGIRKRYLDEHNSLEVSAAISYLTSYPLTHRHMIAMQVLKAGSGSNELSWLYGKFLDHVKTMRIIKDANDLEFEFSRFVGEHIQEARKAAQQKASEIKGIKEEVALLNARWKKSLPGQMQELGAGKSILFSRWRDEILDGKRPAPRDFELDYYLYLLAGRYL